MQLVKYAITDDLINGLFLPGTNASDFGALDDEREPGFIIAHYKGSMDDARALGLETYEMPALQQPIDIVIENVTGALEGFTDEGNQYTVPEGVDIVATGTLLVPDQKFRVPFQRVDTGRVQPMVAEVVEGEFKLVMNFKTAGEWVVNNALVNSKFPSELFNIEDHVFYVI